MNKASVSTVAELRKTAGSSSSELIFCAANGVLYRFLSDARLVRGNNTAPTDDGYLFVAAAQGGNSFWLKADAKPYVRLDKSAVQSLNDSTFTKLTFDNVVDDPFALYNSGSNRIGGNANGCPLGMAVIFTAARFQSVAAGTAGALETRKNGSAGGASGSVGRATNGAGASGSVQVNVSFPAIFDASSDYWELWGWHNHGSSRNVSAGSDETFFGMIYTDVWKWAA